jgi:two-component system catabolic regulation response regulator CreB
VPLTRIEYRLLETLYEHRPEDVSLQSLLIGVWGTTEGMGTAELVRTHVRNLRQKLAQLGLPDAIRSHRGRGYALDA